MTASRHAAGCRPGGRAGRGAGTAELLSIRLILLAPWLRPLNLPLPNRL